MKRETIAKDILDYCKEKNTKFFTTKFAVGDVISSETEKAYTSNELAVGVRLLREVGLIKRVSNKRWQVLSYDITPYL
jgi:hypothetical protein